jgi:hypothetical protein
LLRKVRAVCHIHKLLQHQYFTPLTHVMQHTH